MALTDHSPAARIWCSVPSARGLPWSSSRLPAWIPSRWCSSPGIQPPSSALNRLHFVYIVDTSHTSVVFRVKESLSDLKLAREVVYLGSLEFLKGWVGRRLGVMKLRSCCQPFVLA